MSDEPGTPPLPLENGIKDDSGSNVTAEASQNGPMDVPSPATTSSPPAKICEEPPKSPKPDDAPNGPAPQDDSEAETEILPESQQSTPAKGRQIGDEINGQLRRHHNHNERSGLKKDQRKRKKGSIDAENDSDSSWASDGSATFKKPRLSSPKTEIKTEDELQPISTRASGNESMARLRKRKAQNDITDLSGTAHQGKDSQSSSLSPRARPQRGTTHEPAPRAPSPHRRLHRRAASIHSALPTIETRRSKRNTHNPRDASTPSSPDEFPAQVTPLPSGIMAPRRGRDHFGDTPLARLSAKGDLAGVRNALEQNFHNLNEANNAGNTPLHHASLKGHDAVVELLLQKGCKTEVVNAMGESPLHDAVGNSHVACVRLLLDAGLDPREANNVGETPKDLVSDSEDGQKIEELLTAAIRNAPERASSAGMPQGPSQSGGYSRAAPGGTNLRLVTYSVKALQDYAAHGNEDGVNEMLRAGIDPDQNCVIAAAAAGHDGILSIFLSMVPDKDPDPKLHKDNTPLLKAIGKGHLKVLNVLLNHVNPKRKTYHGNQTYPEVARDARGPNWLDEVKMLERAYEGKNPDFSVPDSSTTPISQSESNRLDQSASSSPEPVKRRRRLVQSKQLKTQSASGPATSRTDAHRLAAPVANMTRLRPNASDASQFSQKETHRRDSDANKLTNGDANKNNDNDNTSDSKDEATDSIEEEGKPTKTDMEEEEIPHMKSEKTEQEMDAARKAEADERAHEEEASRKRKEAEKEKLEEIAKQEAENEKLRREEAEKAAKAEAQRKEKLEQARAEAARRKEEEARAQREEEARKQAELEKQRLEEERRREEAERARQQEEKRKAEEAERRDRIARELEQRKAYLDKMPNGLKHPLSLGTSYPVDRKNLNRVETCLEDWMPVQVVQRHEIEPACTPEQSAEWMMLNLHAAVILGEQSLQLESFPAWQRFECTSQHKKEMLPYYRHFLHAEFKIHRMTIEERTKMGLTGANYAEFVNLEEAKWHSWPLSWLFWIRFDDFIAQTAPEISPRLKNFKIIQAAQCHPRRVAYNDAVFQEPRFLWEPVVRQAEEMARNGGTVSSTHLDAFFKAAKANMPRRMIYVNGMAVDQSPAPL